MFVAYNLSQKYRAEEWKEKWLLATCNVYNKAIPKPVLTRWEHVGIATQYINTHLTQWIDVMNVIVSTNAKTSEVGLIVTQLAQLLAYPMIIAHVYFVCAYNEYFFQKHFDWLK